MKSSSLFILFFACISCTSNFKIEKKTDWEEFGLKGNVKSFTQLPYYAVMNMGYIMKSEPGTDAFQWSEYGLSITFDKKGRILKKISYKGDNTIDNTIYYKYDADSLITTSTSENFTGRCFVQKYNANQDLIKDYILDKGNKIEEKIYIYLLDDRGNKIEEVIIDSEVRIINRYLYKYDKDDLRIETNSFTNDYTATTNYEYNKQRQLTKEYFGAIFTKYEYSDEGLLIFEKNSSGSFTEYKYNEKKELIERKMFISGGSDNIKKEYEFDKNGNWIKCVIYINSKLTSLIERGIEYY